MPLLNTYTETALIPARNPEDAEKTIEHVAFAPNLNLAKGTVLGKITATGKHAAYNNANADGTETALRLITQYPVVTDANGKITNLNTWGALDLTAPCFTQGYFRTEDLTGLDAAGVTDIKAVIVLGDLTTGLIEII